MSGPIVRKWTGLGSLGPCFLSDWWFDILVRNYKLWLIDQWTTVQNFNIIISDQNIRPQIRHKLQTKTSQAGPFTDYPVRAVIFSVEN